MRITKFEADLFWDADDPETSHLDPEDILDGMYPGDIVEIQQAKSLPNFFGVDLGEDASGVALYEFFDNEEEAQEASRLVRDPKCKHENCGYSYACHSAAACDTEHAGHKWKWGKSACPISDAPFHPTQTFKETA